MKQLKKLEQKKSKDTYVLNNETNKQTFLIFLFFPPISKSFDHIDFLRNTLFIIIKNINSILRHLQEEAVVQEKTQHTH